MSNISISKQRFPKSCETEIFSPSSVKRSHVNPRGHLDSETNPLHYSGRPLAPDAEMIDSATERAHMHRGGLGDDGI